MSNQQIDLSDESIAKLAVALHFLKRAEYDFPYKDTKAQYREGSYARGQRQASADNTYKSVLTDLKSIQS